MRCVLAVTAATVLCLPVAAADEGEVVFKDCFDGELAEGWSWIREDPEDWRIVDGALEIRARPGHAQTVRNALVRDVPWDAGRRLAFEVTVTFTAPPTEQYEQAGLTWYHDGDPVFKVVHELIDGRIVIVPGFAATEKDTVRLRLVVDEGRYQAQFRQEGEEEYHTVQEGELPVGEDDQISIQTYHGPADADHWMQFRDFRILRLP